MAIQAVALVQLGLDFFVAEHNQNNNSHLNITRLPVTRWVKLS